MPTVTVKPELILWAIDRSGLPTGELLKKFPKLKEWTTGDRRPTFRQLEEFARKTMTPFGLLLLDEPPEEELPIPDFRTVGDISIERPSPNLIDTIHDDASMNSFTDAMSLSPRPLRLMMIAWFAGSSGAIFMTCAIA